MRVAVDRFIQARKLPVECELFTVELGALLQCVVACSR